MTLDNQASRRQQFRRSHPTDLPPPPPATSSASNLHLPLQDHRVLDQQNDPADNRLADPLDHRQMADPTEHRKLPEPGDHRKLPEPGDHRKLPDPSDHRKLPDPADHRKLPDPKDHRKLPEPGDHRKLPDPVGKMGPNDRHLGDHGDPLDHRLRDPLDHRDIDLHNPIEPRLHEGQKPTGRRLPDPHNPRLPKLPTDDGFFDRGRGRMTIHLNDGYNRDASYHGQSDMMDDYGPMFDHRLHGKLSKSMFLSIFVYSTIFN